MSATVLLCLQVRKLVMQGVSLNSVDAAGYTALHHAVRSGCIQTVLMCLPRESPIGEILDVPLAAHDRNTALHFAARQGLSEAAHAITSYAQWMVRTCPEAALAISRDRLRCWYRLHLGKVRSAT
jgi:ankyrin repeat protein